MKKYYILILLAALSSAAFPAMAQNLLWAKSAGGTTTDIGHAIRVDGAGNVYTTGTFKGTVDFDPGPGSYNLTSAGDEDIFFLKTDAAGNFTWAKKVGGGGLDHVSTMVLDAAGNIYTTGEFVGTADFDPGTATHNLASAGMDDIFILKLDSAGNYLWAESMGSTDQDEGFSMALDGFGNLYVTGNYFGTVDFDAGAGSYSLTVAGGYDVFILKLDASGNFGWAKSLGGADWDFAIALNVDQSGNVYTTGYFQLTADFDPGTGTYNMTSAGNYDIFISALDGNGNFMWADRIGGNDVDYGFQVVTDAAGNVFVAGEFKGTVDFDPGAGVVSLTSLGTYDVFICKLDASGDFDWVKTFDGTLVEYINEMVLDGEGNIYTTGYFQGTTDFDPGTANASLTSLGMGDIFISKLDKDGNYVWTKSIGSAGNDIGVGISLDNDENIYVTGYFTGTVDFDPGVGSFELTSAGDFDVFMLKLGNAGQTGIDEAQNNIHHVSVFPNPGEGFFHISSESSISEIRITNSLGQSVQQFHPNKKDSEFFLDEAGIYFIRVESGGSIITKKIVVQK